MTNSNDLTATQATPHIEHLPNEILLKILKDMSPESIVSLMQASKSLSSIKLWGIVFSKMLNAPLKVSNASYLPAKRVGKIKKLFNTEWFNDTETIDAKKSAISNLKLIVNHKDFFEPLLDKVMLVSSRKANPKAKNQEEIQKIADRNFGVIQHNLPKMTKELQTILILSVLARAFRKYTCNDITNNYYEEIEEYFSDGEGFFDPTTPPQESIDLLYLCLLAKKYFGMEDTAEIQKSINQVRDSFYQFIDKIINCYKVRGKASQTFSDIFCNIYTSTASIKGLCTEDLNQRLIKTIVNSLIDHKNPNIHSTSTFPHDLFLNNTIYFGLLQRWSMAEIKALCKQSELVNEDQYTHCKNLGNQLIDAMSRDITYSANYSAGDYQLNSEHIKLLYILKLSVNTLAVDYNHLQEILEELELLSKEATDDEDTNLAGIQASKKDIQHLLDDITLDETFLPSISRLSL